MHLSLHLSLESYTRQLHIWLSKHTNEFSSGSVCHAVPAAYNSALQPATSNQQPATSNQQPTVGVYRNTRVNSVVEGCGEAVVPDLIQIVHGVERWYNSRPCRLSGKG